MTYEEVDACLAEQQQQHHPASADLQILHQVSPLGSCLIHAQSQPLQQDRQEGVIASEMVHKQVWSKTLQPLGQCCVPPSVLIHRGFVPRPPYWPHACGADQQHALQHA